MTTPARLVPAFLIVVLAQGVARAQEPPPGEEGGPAIEKKIPKDLENTVRVKFHLKNGSKVTGYVKNGRFVESIRDHRFIRTEELEGNGVRVWPEDVAGDSGFIFLEWSQIRDIEILRPPTETEAKTEEAEAERKRRERLERARRVDAQTRAYFDDLKRKEEEAARAKAEREKEEAAAKQLEAYQDAKELLEKFPADKGWGQEKYDQIRLAWLRDKNKIVPQGENKEFYEKFEKWKQAVQWKEQGLLEDLPPRDGTATEGAGPSGEPAKPAGPADLPKPGDLPK